MHKAITAAAIVFTGVSLWQRADLEATVDARVNEILQAQAPVSQDLPELTDSPLLPTNAAAATTTTTATLDRTSTIERAAMAVVLTETPTGTGFIFDDIGHILTNAHVVDGHDTVTYQGSIELIATVVSMDTASDLAIIRVETEIRLEKLEIISSEAVGLGETVNVLGFPFGRFLGTSISIAEGIVSAERTLYGVDYFQIDAAINPGNSGGPLLNVDGQVIGIATSRFEKVYGMTATGIGLAITADHILEVLPSMLGE